MKNRKRKAMHKAMMKYIHKINASFKNDEWFNGKFRVEMCDEFYGNSSELIMWYLYFIDDRNPLNTSLYRTECHYYHSCKEWAESHEPTEPYRPVDLSFEYARIYQALNSWLQYCSHGEVFDSPSHCDMIWGIDNKRKSKFINNCLPKVSMPKVIKEYVKNAIANFNSANSIVMCKNNIHDSKYLESDQFKLQDFQDEHLAYNLIIPSLAYDLGVILKDSNNKFQLLLVKVDDQYYVELFENDLRYKPKFKSIELTTVAYPIDIKEFDVDGTLQCYLYLNGVK